VHATARVYLRSLAGPAAEAYRYPYLIEGFRERDWLTLSHESTGDADGVAGEPHRLEARLSARRLWSAGVVRRLQLGGTAQAGYSRLVSVGDPATDPFACYAHRIRAVVPAGWVRSAAQQRLLERGLRVELPAHVTAEVTLVEPYFQAGGQATLGIDTVAAPAPLLRLRSSEAVTPDRAPAPARRPRGRLGYDTVLAGGPHAARHHGTPAQGDRYDG
jgi:hypothetical protein